MMNSTNATAVTGSVELTMRVMRLTLYPLTLLVGTVGNILVCALICIWRKKDKFNPSRYFILNLSISDLFVLIMFIPFDMAYLENNMVWKYGLTMCKLISTLSFLSVIVSGTTLAAISIDRYRAVVHPLNPPFMRRTVFIIIIVIWIYAIATSMPFIESLKVFPSGTCENDHTWWPSYEWVQVTFILCFFCPGFVIPMTCISVCYVLIGHHLRKERRNQLHAGLLRSDIARIRARQNSKTIKILTSLVVAYVICTLPNYIVIMISVFYKNARFLPIIRETHEFTRLLMTANSCLNPVLYSVISREFRAALKSLLTRKTSLPTHSSLRSNSSNAIFLGPQTLHTETQF